MTSLKVAQRDSLQERLLHDKEALCNQPKPKLDTLSRIQIFGYGVGHFQNDLCAACWFNYMLYFMKNVVFLSYADSGFYAGIVLLSGQIADGIFTPLVGYFSDKTNTKIGKRTPWYIAGTVIITICFLFIFQECLFCQWFNDNNSTMMLVYYILFPSLFNVGWAAVQVSHMSLVPSLTLSRRQRDKLNTMRNTFTYIANLYVLAAAFLIFLTVKTGFDQFRILGFAAVGLGFLTSMFFLSVLREKKLTDDCIRLKKILDATQQVRTKVSLDNYHKSTRNIEREEFSIKFDSPHRVEEVRDQQKQGARNIAFSDDENNNVAPSISNESVKGSLEEKVYSWTQWFSKPSFYIYGFVYMGSRVLVNVQSSLIIFYLQNVLGIAEGVNTYDNGLPIQFAIIPMIIYLSSSLTSVSLKSFYEKFGRKKIYVFGTFIAVLSTVAMMFFTKNWVAWMYGLSIFLGVSQSICLNTGIAMISEVIGVRGPSAAFVFGFYSLLEKFANGILLYAIMNIEDVSDPSNATYIRICASVVPTCGALLACFLVLIGNAKDYDSGDVVTGSVLKNSNDLQEEKIQKSSTHSDRQNT